MKYIISNQKCQVWIIFRRLFEQQNMENTWKKTWTKPMDLQSFSSLGVARNPGRFGWFSVAAGTRRLGQQPDGSYLPLQAVGGTGIPIGIPWDLGNIYLHGKLIFYMAKWMVNIPRCHGSYGLCIVELLRELRKWFSPHINSGVLGGWFFRIPLWSKAKAMRFHETKGSVWEVPPVRTWGEVGWLT